MAKKLKKRMFLFAGVTGLLLLSAVQAVYGIFQPQRQSRGGLSSTALGDILTPTRAYADVPYDGGGPSSGGGDPAPACPSPAPACC